MLRNRVLVKTFALWIVTGAPLLGQTEPTTSGAGHDYFTAEQDGVKPYLENMTINHLNKVTGWIQQGRMDNAVVIDLTYVLDRFPNQPRALQLLPPSCELV